MADGRPSASVAIIGNDAVLAATPATPVQIAHACLRRGYSVAVPASWGDELVAAEAMRRLATRERGPAVMCVCPYVRSRLLTPGPDLAPFLVSLVPPPVAVARYLRAAYGPAGVHVTYVGGCPGADDPAIDVCLTPDAFLADLAEHDIALSEQPLVFDSIVPPDRRRWCSLPGGVPTAEALWGDADPRTLVEIDRGDVSTDLAQHIIAHEHVLLDLAPSLGCACSGAVGSVAPRDARVAVAALEPPRALGPILDPVATLPLEIPVRGEMPAPPAAPPTAAERVLDADMETQLDRFLGTQAVGDPPTAAPALGGRGDTLEISVETSSADVIAVVATESVEPSAPESPAPTENTAAIEDTERFGPESASGNAQPTEPRDAGRDATLTPPRLVEERSNVRRHAPLSASTRHTPTSIPRVTASDGRPLPRAYVAKRRTPAAGIAPVTDPIRDAAAEAHAGVTPASPLDRDQTTPPTADAPTEEPAPPTHPQPNVTPDAAAPDAEPPSGHVPVAGPGSDEQPSATPRSTEPPTSDAFVPPPSAQPTASIPSPIDSAAQPEPRHGAAAAVPDNNPSALVVLLVALLALGFFVLRSLN